MAGLVCGKPCSSFSEGTILHTYNLTPQFLSAWGQVYCKLYTSAYPRVLLCMRKRSSFLPLSPVWQLLLRGAGIEMADPTIQIFCCHRPTVPGFPNNILMEFHSDLYNIVCVMSSLLGIVGAVQQVWVLFWLCVSFVGRGTNSTWMFLSFTFWYCKLSEVTPSSAEL